MNACARLRKEFKITTISKNFKSIFGISNRKDPLIMYIKLNTWVNYSGDLNYYNENINKLNSRVKLKIKDELNKSGIFDTTFFYTPELKKILYKGQSTFHACFEITIKQKKPIETDIAVINNKIESMINNLINTIENNHNFNFMIKKNGTV